VRTVGNVPEQNNTPTTADIGISRKEIHEARIIRDAEKADPGIPKAWPSNIPSKLPCRRFPLQPSRARSPMR
jgi:hypothetical protein